MKLRMCADDFTAALLEILVTIELGVLLTLERAPGEACETLV